MPPNSFLLHSDQVSYTMAFPPGLLLAPAITNAFGFSKATDMFRKLLVEGEEARWIVFVCPYTASSYIIPGVIKCSIKQLAPTHKTKKMKLSDKNILLVGSAPFQAELKVIVPAREPDPPAGTGLTDPIPQYMGTGTFIETGPRKGMEGFGAIASVAQKISIALLGAGKETTATGSTGDKGGLTMTPAAQVSPTDETGSMPSISSDIAPHPGLPGNPIGSKFPPTPLPSDSAFNVSSAMFSQNQ